MIYIIFQGCNLLCQAGQFELSRAKLVEILLDFDKLGTGHSLANTDINFERVKVCIPAIILSDPTVSDCPSTKVTGCLSVCV